MKNEGPRSSLSRNPIWLREGEFRFFVLLTRLEIRNMPLYVMHNFLVTYVRYIYDFSETGSAIISSCITKHMLLP